MLQLLEVTSANRVQILNETVDISHGVIPFEKGMNPIILPLVMGKW